MSRAPASPKIHSDPWVSQSKTVATHQLVVSNVCMWKESVIYVQKLKSGTKIKRSPKQMPLSGHLAWPLSTKYQEAGERQGQRWLGEHRRRGASSQGRIFLANSKLHNERKDLNKCQVFSGIREDG